MQQAMPDYNHKSPDEMELLERSYQLAAQYMGNGNGGNYQPTQPQEEEKGKRNVLPVAQVSRNVVSSLGSSSNRGFNTSVGVQKTSSKNTISAVVANDQTIANGQPVRLRLTEPMWVGNRLVPRNTIIMGESRLQGERLEIEISSVESEGSVYEVELRGGKVERRGEENGVKRGGGIEGGKNKEKKKREKKKKRFRENRKGGIENIYSFSCKI